MAGPAVGLSVGFVVGCAVGCIEGVAVGVAVGWIVGEVVGLATQTRSVVALGVLKARWSSVHCVRAVQVDSVVSQHVPFRKVSAVPLHGSSSQSPLATLQSSVDGLSPYTALAL